MTFSASAVHAALVIVVFGLLLSDIRDLPSREDAPKPIEFDRDVRPIFSKHCVSCHGPVKPKNGLRLDRKADAASALVPGKSAESLLFQLVTGQDKDRPMPPKGGLSATEIATLKAWIDQGARWPDDGTAAQNVSDWWSFKPLRKPVVPQIRNSKHEIRNEIDRFVLAKLSDNGLSPSSTSDRRTLIRRLYFDLIGLPPAPEEVEAFVRNNSPDAYEKLVDQLLASSRFGERWARHWLDVVHFGETHGYDKDKPRPNAWPYRDYVIRAFNSDKPYARFVQEQIAGDVLFPGTVDGIEALGFLAAGPWDFIGHVELPETKIDGKVARHLDRDDFVSNTIGTFMGLTVHCAQCHNHKFDPIAQEDYYRLQAVFAAIDRSEKFFDADPRVAAKRAELQGLHTAGTAIFGVAGAEPLRRSLVALPPPRMAYIGTIHTGTGTFVGTGSTGGKPRAIHLLSRGDVTKPLKEVTPGAIVGIPGLSGRFELPPNHTEGDRRAALAKWLTDANNPLTWRVMANRVWQYHFGRGLVDTPNDFGKMGQFPTHPELLDYLAAELRDHQSLKKLHKLIVMSATYRQVSTTHEANAKIDVDNRYLWQQNRRKLEGKPCATRSSSSRVSLTRPWAGRASRIS